MPPPPRSRERGGGRDDDRKRSRSSSPAEHRQKRSWQVPSYDRSQYNRSPPRKKKDFKSPPRFDHGSSRKNRSRSPKYHKRGADNNEGFSRYSSKDDRPRSPERGGRSDFGSGSEARSRKRSPSPPPRHSARNDYHTYKGQESRKSHASRSPEPGKYFGQPSKRKLGPASPLLEQHRKFSRDRSPSPAPPPSKKPVSSHHQRPSDKESLLPQRKVSASSKKKTSHTSLHTRFTAEDSEAFRLHRDDNVTIAILRNPRAEPTEDVNVKRIFDASQFKMVHSKTAGRKPIFDREEIKAWRHDENMEDDAHFEERRLVRVKAVTKKAADSMTRVSPDVLRLNPKPDSRYESQYPDQTSKEDGGGSYRRRRKEDEEEDRFRHKRDEDRFDKGDDYDLRQALDRRRSGKDDEFDDRKDSYSSGYRRHQEDDRNVVMEQERGGGGRGHGWEKDDRDYRGGRRGGWDNERRRGWGRGRGRGPRRAWSPRRPHFQDRDGGDGHNTRGSYDSRRGELHNLSPGNNNYRGRGGYHGRSRGQSFVEFEDVEDMANPPADDYYKYAQHDDRDISPKGFRGRGRGGRFPSRGFRAMRGFRGGRRGRGFRTRGRGRGFFQQDDVRSIEKDERRSVDHHSSEREWKHDMYDSVQSGEEEEEEELPHSTTVNN